MELIRTVDDDAELQYQSADDSNDEERPVTSSRKSGKLKSGGQSDFFDGFSFVSESKEYLKDTWSDVSKYIKKKKVNPNRTTTDQKIEKVKQKLKTKKRPAPDDEDEEDEHHDEEDQDSGSGDSGGESDSDLSDSLKMKASEVKRKAKKKQKNGKNPKVVIEAESAEDEADPEDPEYFEDPEPFDESASFYSMKLSRPLLKAIESMKFVHPTPIQTATIPTALAGRDICGCAATGTGKTAAYMLPILERLLYRPNSDVGSITRVLVLVPTRELGVQVFQVTKQLAQFTNVDVALSVGGLDLRLQEAVLRKNPDMVIATPGRLIDHLKNTPSFTLDSIEVLVLDEADRLLDECFLEQIKEVVQSCSPTRQTMLFSATMTDRVSELAAVSLRKPVKIFVDSNKAVAWNLQQEFVRIRPAQEKVQEAILASLLLRTFRDHVIVFIRTKQHCHRLHILLGLLGIRVGELHGNMSQTQRLDSLKRFKDEQMDVLLTTDVAARGLDISGVKTVINFQLPDTLEQYIHRVGRTARAGRAGRSVSFAIESQRKVVREIVRHARNPVKSRVVPAPVVAKYDAKIKEMATEVQKILEEEKAEREIAMLENRANRITKEIEQGVPSQPARVWFKKGDSAKKSDDKKKKGGAPQPKRRKRKQMAEKEGKEDSRVAQYARQSKRAHKAKKIRAVVDK